MVQYIFRLKNRLLFDIQYTDIQSINRIKSFIYFNQLLGMIECIILCT